MRSIETLVTLKETFYFVCPICRIAFENGAGEAGVECPGCHFLLSCGENEPMTKSSNEFLKQLDLQRAVEWEQEDTSASSDVGSQADKSVKWVIALLCVALLFVAYLCWQLFDSEGSGVQASSPPVVKTLQGENEVDMVAAERVLRDFFLASSVEGKWEFVHLQSISRDRFEAFYSSRVVSSTDIFVLSSGWNAKNKVIEYRVKSGLAVSDVFVKFDGEAYTFDWCSYSGWNPILLSQLKVGDEGDFRCFVGFSNNYDFAYPEEKWVSLVCQQAGSELPFYVFVSRDDTVLMEGLPQQLSTRKKVPMILTLARAKGNHADNKYELKAWVSKNWFKP